MHEQEPKIYVGMDGQTQGPFSRRTILQMLKNGDLTKESLAIRENEPEERWRPVADLLAEKPAKPPGRAWGGLIWKLACILFASTTLWLALKILSYPAPPVPPSSPPVEVRGGTAQEETEEEELNLLLNLNSRLTEAAGELERTQARAIEEVAAHVENTEIAKAEVEKLRGDLARTKDVATHYFERFGHAALMMENSDDIPLRFRLLVNTDKGVLKFDAEKIRKTISAQFLTAGYEEVGEDDDPDPFVFVVAWVQQLELIRDTSAAYDVGFRVYVRAVRGERECPFLIHEDSRLGSAGFRAAYTQTVLDLFRKMAAEGIEALAKARAEDNDSDLLKDISKPLKSIEGLGVASEGVAALPPEERGKSGSGIILSRDGMILTNHHVVAGRRKLRVLTGFAEEPIPVKIIASDPPRDLALLKALEEIPGIDSAVLPVLSRDDVLKTGSALYTLGHPLSSMLGDEIKYSEGALSAVNADGNTGRHFQHSMPTQPGNSGGPIFTKEGEFAGVVVATLNPFRVLAESASLPQNVNYGIKPSAIRRFLLLHDVLDDLESGSRGKLSLEEASKLCVKVEVE